MFKTFKSVSEAMEYLHGSTINCNLVDIKKDLLKSGLVKINDNIICIDKYDILN